MSTDKRNKKKLSLSVPFSVIDELGVETNKLQVTVERLASIVALLKEKKSLAEQEIAEMEHDVKFMFDILKSE